ncbi:alpha/beta fold hydrolase [Polyangium spumosum]|uniref:Alpha/beta fold hydrolase n=1 Tax=Polyangium spumosum TaxID=889282 RepID=A0A6N7PYQ0_9BACT|nr:alpha/beta hydrolase [Polyangium spumosum]MRG97208.1 alpha/beta fold hydrolase [Polyangium spumosum]
MLSVDVAHGVDAGMFVRDYHASARKTPLVYLHGLAGHGLVFEAVALHPRLAAHRHVVPDLPGHGRSIPAPRPAPLTAFADHFARWLGGRFGERVALVGYGLGGTLAMLVAERHPSLVRAVVDVDGPKTVDDCASLRPAAELTLTELGGPGIGALRDAVRRASRATTAAEDPGRVPCDARLLHAWGRELVALADEGSLALRLARLSVPALFVTGSRGSISQRSLERLAEARVVVAEMPDAGPSPFLDRPHEFAAILGDFLRFNA